MNRRRFVTLVGGSLAWPMAAQAQSTALPVVGFLNGQAPKEYMTYVDAFRQALVGAGFVDGRNVAIEFRWAEGRYDRLRALATELVNLPATVILATGTTAAAVAAKSATKTIPIVFTTAGDPVKEGLVQSLNRPGGNITGISFQNNETGSKRLELLHEIVPNATSIGYLINPANPNTPAETEDLLNAGRVIGRRIQVVGASSEREIETTFATFAQQKVGALVVGSDAFFCCSSSTTGRPGCPLRPASDLCLARAGGGRRSDELRCEPDGRLSTGRRLRRAHTEGRETSGHARHATDEVRLSDQPQDRQGTRH